MLPDRSFFFRLADAAKAETLPRFRSSLDVVNKEAGGFDPVTEGDRAAEAAIRTLIEQEFPDHGILGVAGDKQDFQGRATHPRSIGDLAAIHTAW